ncbi:MAG: STAS domain-containing protein [Planctomycetales bacterium]|nr:STAS domain-containing protein [Planctomycetales bacterium]
MVYLNTDWQLDVARGPGCVIVRPHHFLVETSESVDELATDQTRDDVVLSHTASLAEDIWDILSKHMTYRVVLDMDDVDQLTSRLLGQLIALQHRVDERGGTVQVCGLSASNENVLDITKLRNRIPSYGTRDEAVLGRKSHPTQPR